MKRIDPSTLEFGKPLPFDLLDWQGKVYRCAGQVLEQVDLTKDAERLTYGLFVGERDGEDGEGGGRDGSSAISVSSLKTGRRSPVNLYDENGSLMLPAGVVTTDRVVEQLRRRGTKFLFTQAPSAKPKQPAGAAQVHQSDGEGGGRSSQPQVDEVATVQTPATRRLDRTLGDMQSDLFQLPTSMRLNANTKRLPLSALRQEYAAGTERYDQTVDQFADVATSLVKGRVINVGMATDMLLPFVHMLNRDATLPLLLLQLQNDDDEFLFHHSMNVALITMTVAQQMGFAGYQVIDAAVGALFQDIGMLAVPAVIRKAPRQLTQEEWQEVERHPIRTVDILERLSAISPASLMIGYQSHERCDRSGYPRRREHAVIHPLARIVGAADMYAAMTCPRPHRQADSPFTAMTTLMREAKSGRLDKEIVRAFLHSMSLFPVGSYVRLSDGATARVLRANSTNPKQPVVVPLRDDRLESSVEIDLSRQDMLSVTETLLPDEVLAVGDTAA